MGRAYMHTITNSLGNSNFKNYWVQISSSNYPLNSKLVRQIPTSTPAYG
jgi:hypothetical protein